MRVRLLALGALFVILALQWSREAGRAIAPPTREGPVDAAVGARPPLPDPPPLPGNQRDPFRFEAIPLRVPEAARRRVVRESPTPSAVARAEPLRLVGFLRQSGRIQAVVALDGEISLVVAGDRVGAFFVAAVDADEGRVRLRGEDEDRELTLSDER